MPSGSALNLARKAIGKIESLVSRRPRKVAWPGGVISFTFDDVPKSGFANGGAILERNGLCGTYYVSGKLADTDSPLGHMCAAQDIRTAHRRGHEIACHTYTHLNCAEASRRAMLREMRQNAQALAAILGGFVPTNFAYPFGGVSPLARRTLGPRFSSCRGIRGGINHGDVDLSELLANRIYAHSFDANMIRALIDRNCAVGGWLIFYTHDVTETPSPYGCTPEQFESVVSLAAGSSPVMPVREVMAQIG